VENSQVWYCEKCDRLGIVDYDKQQSDVMSVCYLLEDDHRRLSPDCEVSHDNIGYRKLRAVTDLEGFLEVRRELKAREPVPA